MELLCPFQKIYLRNCFKPADLGTFANKGGRGSKRNNIFFLTVKCDKLLGGGSLTIFVTLSR